MTQNSNTSYITSTHNNLSIGNQYWPVNPNKSSSMSQKRDSFTPDIINLESQKQSVYN